MCSAQCQPQMSPACHTLCTCQWHHYQYCYHHHPHPRPPHHHHCHPCHSQQQASPVTDSKPHHSCSIVMQLSAVTKRPCDASCLSVVSFNSTKCRVESFIVSYVCYRFVTVCSYMRCSVVFGVTLRLLVINISSSSPAQTHKHRMMA